MIQYVRRENQRLKEKVKHDPRMLPKHRVNIKLKSLSGRFVRKFIDSKKASVKVKVEPQEQQQPQDEKQQQPQQHLQQQDEKQQQPQQQQQQQDEKQQQPQNATGKKRGRKRKNEAASVEGAFFILSATIEIESTLYMSLRMNKSPNLLFLFHREPSEETGNWQSASNC